LLDFWENGNWRMEFLDAKLLKKEKKRWVMGKY
jgi:hypothetical protein